jgi:exopolysaccharide production protein ExoZ
MNDLASFAPSRLRMTQSLPDPPRAPDRITLFSIQYLRAGASLAVVAYHALQWCDGGFDVGRAGVDVFFVISGVIMWRVTAGRPASPARFLWRRITRMAPIYWLMTLLVASIAPIWPAFLPEVRPGLRHLLLSLAFIPHLDPRGLPFPTLPPGWTLDYEMIFYVIFAVALAFPVRLRARIAVSMLTALVVIGFMFPQSAYFMGANPMLLQFAAGIGVGVLLERGRLPSRAWGFGLILAALLIWTLVQAGGLFTELWRPLLWGVPAVLTVTGALAIEVGGSGVAPRGLVHRGLLSLGDASYAIYLVHLPATAVLAHTLGYDRPWLFLPLALVISILAGLATRAWIEKPLLTALREAPFPRLGPTGSSRGRRKTIP